MVNEPGTEGGGLDPFMSSGFKEVRDTGRGVDMSEPQFPHVQNEPNFQFPFCCHCHLIILKVPFTPSMCVGWSLMQWEFPASKPSSPWILLT